MKKLRVDSGTEIFRLPGGVLRFNPADPGLFLRLEQADERLRAIDENISVQAADRQIKELLNWVLGPGNDVDTALGGVNLFARGFNGRTVLQNLLDALAPVLQEGAERCAENC